MTLTGGPACAVFFNVSQLVTGTAQPTPAFLPGSHPQVACGTGCLWTYVSAAGMVNAHDSTPGPFSVNAWPPVTAPVPPIVHTVSENLAVAPAGPGQVLDGGPLGVYQTAAVLYSWQAAGPPVRQVGVQTWKTGSGAGIVSYAIRLATPAGAGQNTYLEFGVPVLNRSWRNAYYVGGPSGDQPITTLPNSLQTRAAVDVYVNGLAVWSSSSHLLKPKRWDPPYDAQQSVQWGQALGSPVTTLFLGNLPGGSTRTVSIVIRTDVYVNAPSCQNDSEQGTSYRRCHSQREVLSLPSVLSNNTPYGSAFTPLVRVYTR